jgi:hypothetical protein
VSQAVNYFDAWALWAEGSEHLRTMSMWGIPIYWWGRIGKVMTFLAGGTLVVDLVGPERMSKVYTRYNTAKTQRVGAVLLMGVLVFAAVMAAREMLSPEPDVGALFLHTVAISAGGFYTLGTVLILIHFSASGQAIPAMVNRISLGLFVVGFHFDFLAS